MGKVADEMQDNFFFRLLPLLAVDLFSLTFVRLCLCIHNFVSLSLATSLRLVSADSESPCLAFSFSAVGLVMIPVKKHPHLSVTMND